MMRQISANNAMVFLIMAAFLSACQDSRMEARRVLEAQLAKRNRAQTESLAHYREAVKAYEKEDVTKAREYLNKAIAAYDRNAQAWMLLGLIKNEEGKAFEAASHFHRVSLLTPDRYEPIYNIGIILESFGCYDQAIDAYQGALKLSPNQLEVMENLARCYVRTNRNLEEAKSLIDRSLQYETRPQWRQWLSDCSRRLERKNGVNQ